jgi:hypothetical protein
VLDPLASAQTDYQGTTELYTSGGVIANGQAVVLEYGMSAIRAIAPASMPLAYQVVGIAMNATAGAGEQLRVLKSGFGSAALSTAVPPGGPAPIEVLLDGATNDLTFSDSRTDAGNLFLFRDSGGAPGSYTNDENFRCVFDAGGGATWALQFVTDVNDPATSFTFEHNANNMFDRLGIQESADGVNWANISVPWMQTSNTSAAPWEAQFGGTSTYNRPLAANGWILPKDVATANELGYVTGTPVTVASRYMRFWFVSDGSVVAPGWSIGLSRASRVDAPVYIAADDLSKVTMSSGGALVGVVAGTATSSGSVLVRR